MSAASPRSIVIFDTTLRDGEQSPGCSMNLEEKLEVAQALVDLGVDVIEAGFPIASPGDFEAVREIARTPGILGPDAVELNRQPPQPTGAQPRGHAEPRRSDDQRGGCLVAAGA